MSFINHERPINRDVPKPSEDKLLFFGAVLGISPSFRNGGTGQPLEDARQVLSEETSPDYAAASEYIERELFVPEDRLQ
jgi:hypothetical protein